MVVQMVYMKLLYSGQIIHDTPKTETDVTSTTVPKSYYNGLHRPYTKILQDRIPIAKTVMCELFSTKNRKLEKISVTANFKDRREGG